MTNISAVSPITPAAMPPVDGDPDATKDFLDALEDEIRDFKGKERVEDSMEPGSADNPADDGGIGADENSAPDSTDAPPPVVAI